MWRRSIVVWVLVLAAGCKDKTNPDAVKSEAARRQAEQADPEFEKSRAEFDQAKREHAAALVASDKVKASRQELQAAALELDKEVDKAIAALTEAQTPEARDAAKAKLEELQKRAAVIKEQLHMQNTQPTRMGQ